MECYDPSTNKWTKMPQMKKMCGFVGGILIDRPIHLDKSDARLTSSLNAPELNFVLHNIMFLKIKWEDYLLEGGV